MPELGRNSAWGGAADGVERMVQNGTDLMTDIEIRREESGNKGRWLVELDGKQAATGTLHWEVYDTAGGRIWSGGARTPELFLQAGRYRVKLHAGNTVAEQPVDVVRGERRTLAFGG